MGNCASTQAVDMNTWMDRISSAAPFASVVRASFLSFQSTFASPCPGEEEGRKGVVHACGWNLDENPWRHPGVRRLPRAASHACWRIRKARAKVHGPGPSQGGGRKGGQASRCGAAGRVRSATWELGRQEHVGRPRDRDRSHVREARAGDREGGVSHAPVHRRRGEQRARIRAPAHRRTHVDLRSTGRNHQLRASLSLRVRVRCACRGTKSRRRCGLQPRPRRMLRGGAGKRCSIEWKAHPRVGRDGSRQSHPGHRSGCCQGRRNHGCNLPKAEDAYPERERTEVLRIVRVEHVRCGHGKAGRILRDRLRRTVGRRCCRIGAGGSRREDAGPCRWTLRPLCQARACVQWKGGRRHRPDHRTMSHLSHGTTGQSWCLKPSPTRTGVAQVFDTHSEQARRKWSVPWM
eukprot:scaffold840_cov344-Pavlova_lutheri.AAC.107